MVEARASGWQVSVAAGGWRMTLAVKDGLMTIFVAAPTGHHLGSTPDCTTFWVKETEHGLVPSWVPNDAEVRVLSKDAAARYRAALQVVIEAAKKRAAWLADCIGSRGQSEDLYAAIAELRELEKTS